LIHKFDRTAGARLNVTDSWQHGQRSHITNAGL